VAPPTITDPLVDRSAFVEVGELPLKIAPKLSNPEASDQRNEGFPVPTREAKIVVPSLEIPWELLNGPKGVLGKGTIPVCAFQRKAC